MNDILRDNTNRHFKGQLRTEEVFSFCRKHWICIFPHLTIVALIWPIILIYTFILGAPQIRDLFGEIAYLIFTLILIAVLTFVLHRVFLRIFNYYFDIFVITNYRLVDIDKTVFFKDNRNAIDLKEIQDCTMQRTGILQTLLNYGEIHILLSSVTEPIILKYIPNPDYHFRKINKTKREYILGRQLEKKTTEHFALDRELHPLTEETEYPLTEPEVHGEKDSGLGHI